MPLSKRAARRAGLSVHRHTALPVPIALVILFVSGATHPARAASGACVAPPAGIVGWWPGDTNENDIIGGNNPASVSAVSLVPGEVLDGFTFGTQGYIQLPSSPGLANQQFTWAAWVRPDGAGPNNDTFGSNIVDQNTSSTYSSVALSWRSSDHKFVFLFGGTTTADVITSADAFPTGSFYFVGASYDGVTFRLFVNGKQEASLAQVKTIAYSTSGWTFGSNPPTSFPSFARTWNGVIDELQAFNRALSATELLSIYNAGSAGECKAAPAIGGIVSASAFGGFSAASPGSWIEIYGSNLAGDTRGWTTADFTGVNAPLTLDGTTVTIGGKPAFIDYISPGQVNALIPSDAPTGPQQVILTTTAGGASAPYPLTINATEAGLLAPPSFNVNGTQYAVAFHTDQTYVLPVGAVPGLTSRPATPDEVITLYGVGFGPVIPNIPAGQLVQQLNSLADAFQLSIGGIQAGNQYWGLAPGYTGLYQFNVTVPAAASGNQPLTFTVGGVPGAQTLTLPIGQ